MIFKLLANSSKNEILENKKKAPKTSYEPMTLKASFTMARMNFVIRSISQ